MVKAKISRNVAGLIIAFLVIAIIFLLNPEENIRGIQSNTIAIGFIIVSIIILGVKIRGKD